MSLQRLQVPPAAASVRRVRGVTLIELLVVVGIIAILIAIVVPSIGHVKALAKKAAVQQQLAGLSTALENYFQEFKVFPPSEVLDSSGTAMPAYAGNIKIGRGSALLAEGLPAESYLDVEGRGSLAAGRTGVVALFAEWGRGRWDGRWEAEACAPLVVGGPALDAARQAIRARSGITPPAPVERAAA